MTPKIRLSPAAIRKSTEQRIQDLDGQDRHPSPLWTSWRWRCPRGDAVVRRKIVESGRLVLTLPRYLACFKTPCCARLLSMRYVWDDIQRKPHPKEPAQRPSRRTHDRQARLRPAPVERSPRC